MRSVRLAVILDCCCVLAFVIIGRASRADGLGLFLLGWRLVFRLARVRR